MLILDLIEQAAKEGCSAYTLYSKFSWFDEWYTKHISERVHILELVSYGRVNEKEETHTVYRLALMSMPFSFQRIKEVTPVRVDGMGYSSTMVGGALLGIGITKAVFKPALVTMVHIGDTEDEDV